MTVSVLYRPIEQLLARSIADREARLAAGGAALRVAGQVQLALAAAFALAALVLREPIEDGILGGSSTLFWVMVGAVLAYAGSYYARGVLAGRRRFALYGGLQLMESITRVLFALAVAVGVGSGVAFVALGIAVAPLLSLVVLTAIALCALGRRGGPRARAARPIDDGARPARVAPAGPLDAGTPADERPAGTSAAEPELTLTRGAAYAGGVLLVMACEQTFLNAGPLLVNATVDEGAVAAGLAFNALLIARAPLQLFQAVQASILPHLTRLRASGRGDPFHRSVRVTLMAIAGFAALVTVALLVVGPRAMDLLFGGEVAYARGGLGLMGVGMGLYLGAATLTQAALARGQAGRASARWVVAALVFVMVLLSPVTDDAVLRIEIAFAAGALVLFSLLLWLYRRGERGRPGSPEAGSW